eukprot:Filipodium_phascolosomae@DN4913_c0_g1_i1.p1
MDKIESRILVLNRFKAHILSAVQEMASSNTNMRSRLHRLEAVLSGTNYAAAISLHAEFDDLSEPTVHDEAAVLTHSSDKEDNARELENSVQKRILKQKLSELTYR